MYAANRRLILGVVAVLLLAALLGYVAGHSHAASASGQKTRSLLAGSVLVEAPADWRVASTAPAIPGLTVANTIVVAPGGDADTAGLLSGELPAGGPTPLPAPFLADVSGVPETQVVNLVQGQAYRYSKLHVTGYGRLLTVYAVPNPGGQPEAVACYAAVSASAQMRTCEQMVATLTLVNHSHSYVLSPEPGYAHLLSNVMSALERSRVPVRRAISQRSAANAQGLAATLAAAFGEAASSLSVLEPPLVVSRAQSSLEHSFEHARDAYYALSGALGSGSSSSYETARTQVNQAEANVNAALENLTLLGYQPSAPASS
jgi:hypothetical protein